LRPEGGEAENVGGGAVAAEQVAHQVGDADGTAAIVAEIDDDLGYALRLEIGKGLAQRRIRGRDEGAQVDIANPLPAIIDDAGTIAG
jgi:hypothetical protein